LTFDISTDNCFLLLGWAVLPTATYYITMAVVIFRTCKSIDTSWTGLYTDNIAIRARLCCLCNKRKYFPSLENGKWHRFSNITKFYRNRIYKLFVDSNIATAHKNITRLWFNPKKQRNCGEVYTDSHNRFEEIFKTLLSQFPLLTLAHMINRSFNQLHVHLFYNIDPTDLCM
jgi:hypothetical protein